ncbi:MAG: carboxypeptidase-like regulatory domain-containing protein [Terriglobia bacterium]
MRNFKLSWVILVFSLFPLGSTAQAGSLKGGLSGLIQDSHGTPLHGIAVMLLEGRFNSKVVKTVMTDSMGRFQMEGLLPGLYSLKVSAASYPPLIRSGINIVADKIASLNLTLESLYLQSILGVSQEPGAADVEKEDIESVLRTASSTRPILRVFESDSKDESGSAPSGESNEASHSGSGIRGTVRVYAASYDADPDAASVGSTFTDFTIAKQINQNTSLVLAGAVSGSGYAEVDSMIRLGDANGFRSSSIRLSMGVLPYLPNSYTPVLDRSAGRISVYNLELQDEIRLPFRLSLLYGTEIQLSDPAANSPRVRPKLGARYKPTSKTTVSYLRTSSLPHLEKTVDVEEGKTVTLAMPFQHEYGYPLSLGTSRIVHTEYSAEQELNPSSRVMVGYYADSLSPYASYGMMSNSGDPAYCNRGTRITYQRRVSPHLEGLFGYTYGGGMTLGPWVNGFSQNQNFHVLTANVRTQIPSSGTYISAMYRWVSGDSITLIDPYQDTFDSASPGISITFAQAIPYVGKFIPGKLEAQFDVRNLLAKNNLESSLSPYIRRIEFLQPARSMRGGLMLKF